MNMVHPSRYFDRIERYLREATGPKPFYGLEELVKFSGCPDDQVDMTINGALLDFFGDMIPPQNDNVRVYGPDGKAIVEKKKLYSLKDWRDIFMMTINDIPAERVDGILNFMLNKGIIVVDNSTGYVYRVVAMVRRQQLIL